MHCIAYPAHDPLLPGLLPALHLTYIYCHEHATLLAIRVSLAPIAALIPIPHPKCIMMRKQCQNCFFQVLFILLFAASQQHCLVEMLWPLFMLKQPMLDGSQFDLSAYCSLFSTHCCSQSCYLG